MNWYSLFPMHADHDRHCKFEATQRQSQRNLAELTEVCYSFFTGQNHFETKMPDAIQAAASQGKPQAGDKKLKPCCACPETRKPRDAWYEFDL